MFSADDYYAWRKHPVTEQFMESAVESINSMVESLVLTAGDDPKLDARRRGEIAGLKWLFDWVPTVEAPVDVDIDTEVDEDGTTSTGSSDSD
jgi:hypothetical protein